MSETLLIKGGQVVTPETCIDNGWVLVENGVIKQVGAPHEECPTNANEIIHLHENDSLFPGFIDIHIHGAAGHDFMDGKKAVESIAKSIVQEGTTSFLATTITSDIETTSEALHHIADYAEKQSKGAAQLAGIHLEGPFISTKFAGAQPMSAIQSPDTELFKKWNQIANDLIKVVTLAPEEPHAIELITYLHENGIIASAGHSNARFEDMQQAKNAGLKHATHFYNAMRMLHHREPGVVGSVLLFEDLVAEIIFDGIHVRKEMVELAVRTKSPERIILITDSMRGKYLTDGTYDLGGQSVTLKNEEARLEDGTLAGSVLKMNDAVRRMSQVDGISKVDLAKMSSLNAAQSLGLNKKGRIEAGHDADFVILDEYFRVKRTIINGEMVFDAE